MTNKQGQKAKSRKTEDKNDFMREIQKIMSKHPRLYKALAEDKFV
ncbi:MAG: hypothetical protein ACREA8_03340 [Nitrosotalea sp.]